MPNKPEDQKGMPQHQHYRRDTGFRASAFGRHINNKVYVEP
jgi:hypothetical protein